MGWIYTYNPKSNGAKMLANALGFKRIKHENSKFKIKPNRWVINWGASRCNPELYNCKLLNPSQNVEVASNKLKYFQYLKQHKQADIIPEFTENKEEALSWINEGEMVVCRTILNGSQGKGIILAKLPEELVDAPLYVKYIKKIAEYRVHVFNNQVIDIQKKAKRIGVEPVNTQIRNADNGYVYIRNGFDTPPIVTDVSKRAVVSLGLTFGAVDVIYNKKQDRAYALEVNTAPGLEGHTVEVYSEAIKNYIEMN